MIGLLTYLPTTAYFPQYFFMLAFLYVIVRDRNKFLSDFSNFKNNPKHLINWNFLIVALIILFSGLNRLIHWDSVGSINEIFPYFILLIPTYVLAIRFDEIDAKWLIGLISFEAVIVIFEWLSGVSSFDSGLAGFREFSSGSLAYSQRPLGISENSSHIAAKLLLGWLLIDFFKLKEKVWILVKVLLGAAIFMTFNRSVILSILVYLAIRQVIAFLPLRYKLENAILVFNSTIAGFVGLVLIVVYKGEAIVNQFTRNTGTVELTGREYIWADFLEFIQAHLIYGNNSVKLWLDGYHAHNSYIEVIATNGVFISLLYFILIYRNIKDINWVYVVSILIFGITQYAFFWGISLLDIVFWVILFQIVPVKNSAITQRPIDVIP